jgi:hypothetical protein
MAISPDSAAGTPAEVAKVWDRIQAEIQNTP